MDSLCSKNRRRRVGGAGIDFFHVFFYLFFFFLHAVGCCAHSFHSSSCVLFYAMLFIFMSVSVCAGVCVRLCVSLCVCVCGCCMVCPALLGSVAYFLCVFIYLRRFAISKSVRVLPQTKMARFGLTSRSSCLCPGRVWSGLVWPVLAWPGWAGSSFYFVLCRVLRVSLPYIAKRA